MKTYILILFICLVQLATAQNQTFKARAQKAFEENDYVTAAYYYSKSLENGAATLQGKVPYFSGKQGTDSATVSEVRYQLAKSYRLYQNYTLAEGLYKQVIEKYESSFPLSRLWYGICLRSNNRLNEAASQLQLFINSNTDNKEYKQYMTIASNELKDCLFAIAQSKIGTAATIVKLENTFSTEENDFSVSINGGKYWFAGTLSVAKSKSFNQIFVSHIDSLSKKINLGFASDDKFKTQFGTPTLDSTGKKMYLTSWRKEGGKLISGIYLSRYVDEKWTAPERLNNYVNAGGFNAMQPFITPDGKQLYFVSNRVGGQGGYDIWLSDVDDKGLPINAVNMGKGINTAADENTPYYHQRKKRLVFSSKGYIGMGNFDLYESIKKPDSSWTLPRNLGEPYNSTKDDLHYFQDEKEEGMAYISSDRESDCCLNLFRIHFVKPPAQSALLVGTVIDCATQQAMQGVKVELIDALSRQSRTYTTTELGRYEFKIAVKHAYQLRLEKQGYFTKVITIPAFREFKKDTLHNADICLQMFVLDKPIVIENVLYDFNKAILKPESLVVLDDLVAVLIDNPKIKIELSAHTDSIGPGAYNNKLSQQRAQSCVDYIISKGISGFRISARGYGETRPIQANSLPNGKDNREGRRLNRRTEFKVISTN